MFHVDHGLGHVADAMNNPAADGAVASHGMPADTEWDLGLDEDRWEWLLANGVPPDLESGADDSICLEDRASVQELLAQWEPADRAEEQAWKLEGLDETAAGEPLVGMLAGADLDTSGANLLLDVISATQRQMCSLEALRLRAVNELAYRRLWPPNQMYVREGSRHGRGVGEIEAILGWTRWRARGYDSTAHELVELFPDTWRALADGVIELDAARAISEGVAHLERTDQQKVEQIVLGWIHRMVGRARRLPACRVKAKVEAEVIKIDPEASTKRHKDRIKDRGLQLLPAVDSVADLLLHGIPADEAAEIFAFVDAIARRHKATGDERTLSQLRADVAASLLSGRAELTDCDGEHDCGHDSCTCLDCTDDQACPGCDCGYSGAYDDAVPPDHDPDHIIPEDGGQVADEVPQGSVTPVRGAPKAKIVLHASLTELLGLSRQPAILGGYGPVIHEVAERIITHNLDNPNADYQVVVTHPQTGRPIQLHPVNARLFRGRLRDVIDVVHQTCTWVTSCARPAPVCVGDHTLEYAKGGETVQGNGAPLCGPHDWEKTVHGWKAAQPEPGHIIWTSPSGRTYHVEPEPLTEINQPPGDDTDPDPPPF